LRRESAAARYVDEQHDFAFVRSQRVGCPSMEFSVKSKTFLPPAITVAAAAKSVTQSNSLIIGIPLIKFSAQLHVAIATSGPKEVPKPLGGPIVATDIVAGFRVASENAPRLRESRRFTTGTARESDVETHPALV